VIDQITTYRMLESRDRDLGFDHIKSWIELRVSADSRRAFTMMDLELHVEILIDGYAHRRRVEIGPHHQARYDSGNIYEVLVCSAACSAIRGTVDRETAESFVYDLYWHGIKTNERFREWVAKWSSDYYRGVLEGLR